MTEEACHGAAQLTVEQHTWHDAPPFVAPHHHEWCSHNHFRRRRHQADQLTTKTYSGLALALGSDATESSAGHMSSEQTSASMATFHRAVACLLPAPSPQTRLLPSSPEVTIHDGPCLLRHKTGRQCLHYCTTTDRTDFYNHLFYAHIGSELRSLTGMCRMKDKPQILTTTTRIERAKEYMWRCPIDDCLCSTRKESVKRHIELQHKGIKPERAWRIFQDPRREVIVKHILEA
ncbi:hypothetical protein JB92DRAFT_2889220 [Gautieria morchelliformis]|nr:hypothetical protein JB92DRAFT_2889220 [Gautieria morchelliformis]